MHLYKICTLFFFCFFIIPGAYAAEAPDLTRGKVIVPDHIHGVKTMTAEQVIEYAVSTPELTIIDARIRKDRDNGFIEDSISLPDINTNCGTLQEVVEDKDKPLLFYCNGVKCGRSVVSIKVAKSCGYTNLSWFKGGFEEWKNKGFQYVTDE
jgi:rhodanese-related sulfurtransferase